VNNPWVKNVDAQWALVLDVFRRSVLPFFYFSYEPADSEFSIGGLRRKTFDKFFFFFHRRIANPIAMNGQSSGKYQSRPILSKRRGIRKEIWGKPRLRFKGAQFLEVFQSATLGFQYSVVTAGSYERWANVRLVSSGKGSDIRSGETSVREELADDNRTRTVTDVLSY
jgi:hypothetical protein